MKLTSILIILSICVFSCNSDNTKINNESIIDTPDSNLDYVKKKESEKYLDTFKRIVVDGFLVTDEMLRKGGYGKEIKSGNTLSYDNVWFSNDSLNQTLVIGLYTDGFRTGAFLFQNDNMPDELMKAMGLVTSNGEFVNLQVLKKDINGFLSKSSQINKKFFTTEKGIKIGDSVSKALSEYGEPDSVKSINGIDEYEWTFIGDISFDGKIDLKGKPLAKDSYGYQVVMFFKRNKLIGLILGNEVP